MTWLTWRQHRWQFAGLALVLAVYCGYLASVGVDVRGAFSGCPNADGSASCMTAFRTATENYNTVIEILILAHVIPALAGMFWGAPLVAREFEHGTHHMIFTQSVTRLRWLAVKLAVLAAAAALAGAGSGAVVRWSVAAFQPAMSTDPFDDRTFGLMSVPAAAFWIFGLTVGVTAGVALRRTLPAVAVTLAVVVAVTASLPLLRPHYAQPVHTTVGADEMAGDPIGSVPSPRWERSKILRISYVDSTGRRLSSEAAGAVCADPQSSFPTADCLRAKQMRQEIEYQPASRFWRFQLTEAGLLLTASAIMLVVIGWLLYRRLN